MHHPQPRSVTLRVVPSGLIVFSFLLNLGCLSTVSLSVNGFFEKYEKEKNIEEEVVST